MENLKELGLLSEKEKIALMAILEAYGEVLASLYVAECGFCGLYDEITDVKDTVQRLFDKHVYFADKKAMVERFMEEARTSGCMTWQQFMASEEIRTVSNGFVWLRYC